ncbi:MAG: orotidine-5'-phosphate decarboxylase [Pseudomonadota bacterium]
MSELKVIVALDYPTSDAALAMADQLCPERVGAKVGKELFTRAGPDVVRALVGRGFKVFLDLKFHDIPNTVEGACAAAADLGVWMLNVHASGGSTMLAAARRALGDDPGRPRLVAVTVLTSLDDSDLGGVGFANGAAASALNLAKLSRDAGLDGVVCSPREIAAMRDALGQAFLLVTPGVRPAGTSAGDQKRTMTPAEAMHAGSSFLVIGRPITGAADPMTALDAIEQELADL